MQLITFSSILLTVALAAEQNLSDSGQPNPPNWDTDRVKIFSPDDTDCQTVVDEIFEDVGGYCNNGEWSDSRYALMFKPGSHTCNVNVGYYTSVIGLGDYPTDTVLSYLSSPDGCDNALKNFWRSVENVEIGHDQTLVPWHISQAAPMRRVNCVGDIQLGTVPTSGGYISNSAVTGTIKAGSQQQFFFRNTSMGDFAKGAWNFVFLGCEGAPDSHCGNDDIPATTIEQTPLIAEKPYITIDSSGKYFLKRPRYKTATVGVDWDDADVFDFTHVYVASDADSAATINGMLARGFHVVLQPGNYELEESLKISIHG